MLAEQLDGVVCELLAALQAELFQPEARDLGQGAQRLGCDAGAAQVQAAQGGRLLLEEVEEVPQGQNG